MGQSVSWLLHIYIFDVLEAVCKKDVVGLDNLCRVMAGDAKTISPEVGLRHRRVKPPSAKACPPVAPHLVADELKADGVHVPAPPGTFASPVPAGLPSSSSSSFFRLLLCPTLLSIFVFSFSSLVCCAERTRLRTCVRRKQKHHL